MNISSYYSAKPHIAVALMAVAVLLLSLSACKGRRATDMTPSEDTVEVVINEPVETDSIVATDSLSEAGNPNI